MCTVVVSLARKTRCRCCCSACAMSSPAVRGDASARHWAGSPLVGGLDEQAGGTWLAVHPDLPRVACLLNGRGEFAPAARRRSRGELPLLAATGGQPSLRKLHDDPATLARYDPFYLVCADPGAVLLLRLGRPAGRPDRAHSRHPSPHQRRPHLSESLNRSNRLQGRPLRPEVRRRPPLRPPRRPPPPSLGRLAHPHYPSCPRRGRDHRPPGTTRRPRLGKHFGQPGRPRRRRPPPLRLPTRPR